MFTKDFANKNKVKKVKISNTKKHKFSIFLLNNYWKFKSIELKNEKKK